MVKHSVLPHTILSCNLTYSPSQNLLLQVELGLRETHSRVLKLQELDIGKSIGTSQGARAPL